MGHRSSTARRTALGAIGALLGLAVVACAPAGGQDAEAPATPTATVPADECATSPADPAHAPLVAPRDLCEADGQPWDYSGFVLVSEYPSFVFNSDACDDAGQTAFYEVLDTAGGVTLGVADPGTQGITSGFIRVVVHESDGDADSDLLDAMAAACSSDDGIPGVEQIEHGDWRGIAYSVDDDEDDRVLWWLSVDGTLAVVEASYYRLDDQEHGALDADVVTVLDVQAGLLAP